MDLRRDPTNRMRFAKRKSLARRPSPMLLGVIAFAALVHGAAGLAVLTPVTDENPMEIASFFIPLITELAAAETGFEDLNRQTTWLALRNDPAVAEHASLIRSASFRLRPRLDPLPHDLRPAIALIIDDVGLNTRRTRSAIDLPGSITLSFLPYGEHVQTLVHEASWAGHEVYLHLPMEPVGLDNPGPDALLSGLDRADLAWTVEEALNSFDGYTGVNNHMGSRLTQDAGLMAEVMSHISIRNVDFVDSLTSQQSVAYAVARAHDIPSARRDVFIDHEIDTNEIQLRLAETVRVARTNGTAIAIAHPHPESLAALEIWLAELDAMGIDVVPVSEIIRRRNSESAIYAAR